MTSRLPDAVLWDMDGTLVDTEPYWMSAQTALVARFGGVWDHEAALTLVGAGLDHSARVLQQHGVELPADEIIDLLSTSVMERISERMPWRPGARDLLREIRDRAIPTALVTMSIARMAGHVRSYIPFHAFDVVVAGESVSQSKPHPEAYLLAGSLLGVDVADCIAIEDSPPGVASAVAAGAVTIGVPHMVPLDETPAHALWPTLSGRTVADLAIVRGGAPS